jgi:phage terminase large subunit
MVIEAEENDGTIRMGILDSSCWHKRGDTGPSIAETMVLEGCRWKPSDRSAGSRIAGKNEIHRRLQVDEFTEEPRLVITNNCTNLIAQLPVIPLDKNNPEDINTKSEDHLYDALRYGIMSRPRSSLWDYDPMTAKTSGFKISDPVMGY